MTTDFRLIRLGEAKALIQAGGEPIAPEEQSPTRYLGV
jgi:hypothetical protein